jgi:hypothetical protein
VLLAPEFHPLDPAATATVEFFLRCGGLKIDLCQKNSWYLGMG